MSKTEKQITVTMTRIAALNMDLDLVAKTLSNHVLCDECPLKDECVDEHGDPLPGLPKTCKEKFADYLTRPIMVGEKEIKGFKAGDLVYQVDNAGKVYADEIIGILYHTHGVDFDARAIGTSIFATPEEAEQYYKKHY